MKLAVSRNSSCLDEARELVKAALDIGFEGVQFKTSQLQLWDFDPQQLLAIDPQARQLAAAGVVYHPSADFATWPEITTRLLKFVQTLDSTHVCYCFAPPDNLDTTAHHLRETGKRFADVGSTFSFHNHHGTCIGTVDEIQHLCDRLNPTICGLTFDTAHAAKCDIQDLGDAIRKLASHINNIHLKDLNASGTFCPLGHGLLDMSPIVQALHDIDYKDWLVVDEESPTITTPDALKLSMDCLRNHQLTP